MKRIACLLLLLLYLVTTTGTTLHSHYCMGEMVNSSLWVDNEKLCSKCGMQKGGIEDDGCCKDDKQWIKIDDNQRTSTAKFETSKSQLKTTCFVFLHDHLFVFQRPVVYTESNALFRSCNLPAYLLNCIFRI